MRIVTEPEFREALLTKIGQLENGLGQPLQVGCVTGPGRSGAVAAVYASHMLGVPFIPYKQRAPIKLGPLLIVDTAMESGATMRKAVRFYEDDIPVIQLVVFHEPPRVAFWYEAAKPQRYRHEEYKGKQGRRRRPGIYEMATVEAPPKSETIGFDKTVIFFLVSPATIHRWRKDYGFPIGDEFGRIKVSLIADWITHWSKIID